MSGCFPETHSCGVSWLGFQIECGLDLRYFSLRPFLRNLVLLPNASVRLISIARLRQSPLRMSTTH